MEEPERRHFRIAGAYNVRDLGGYDTATGQVTRWGRFLRGDLLADVPAESQSALHRHGIKTAIDLRTQDELLEKPSVLAHSPDFEYVHQNLLGDDELPDRARNFETPKGIADGYVWILEARRSQIRETLSTLAVPQRLPAVFYCAGGTDRTGIIAALLLGVAGVPNETIALDYRLSAWGLVERFRQEGLPRWMAADDLDSGKALETLAHADTMHRTLGYLEDTYGGVTEYVRSVGLTVSQVAALRDALLV
jgi:protein-tyrosine phosphatase